jgi:prevent-host-death family protein
MATVKLKELRQDLEKYYKRVREGESFVVMRRSEPLFKICPVNDGAWEEVIDLTKIQKGGVNINEILKRL